MGNQKESGVGRRECEARVLGGRLRTILPPFAEQKVDKWHSGNLVRDGAPKSRSRSTSPPKPGVVLSTKIPRRAGENFFNKKLATGENKTPPGRRKAFSEKS